MVTSSRSTTQNRGACFAAAAFAAQLRPKAAELLPFHGICAGKYGALGRGFDYAAAVAPGQEIMERLAAEFSHVGVPVLVRA